MKIALRVAMTIAALAVAAFAADPLDGAHKILPEELAKQVNAGKAPLILNIGPRRLYDQAHIKGSEFIGPTSTPDGIAKLAERVKALPKSTAIVLYCGCCPWSHCPNATPGLAELVKLGFTNVKVLYIANNIGADWVDKGYPTEK
jgi:thiosulfate/3-mercaptopyruvate sulfurtransferase